MQDKYRWPYDVRCVVTLTVYFAAGRELAGRCKNAHPQSALVGANLASFDASLARG